MRLRTLLAVVLPPLLLAAIGLTHPHDLTPDSAAWWVTMHIVLVPLFPLLGVAQWILVRGSTDVLSWGVRVAGFGYLVFYGVVDAVAGIGAGTLVLNGVEPGVATGSDVVGRDPSLGWLFAIGNELGTVGAWFFLVGNVLLAVVAWRRSGPRALPGGLILVVAGWLFLDSHIYWPVGVLTMVMTAVGFGLLAATPARSRAAEPALRALDPESTDNR